MLNELERKIIEKAGMDVEDFEPRPVQTEPSASVETEERITALEQALEASLAALRDLGVTSND